jgi:hypothetical protein
MSTPASEVLRQQLRDLRRTLLRLHKLLLDFERAAYEKARGRVSSGELLQLVINHEQFAWLHAISELIVRIDESLDSKEPVTTPDARALLTQSRTLLNPSETGTAFEKRYFQVLQDEPNAVLAHREVLEVLARQE